MTSELRFGQMVRAAASVSVEDTVAWELYHDIRKRRPDAANASGPALPPALLEARVNAGAELEPVDLGVYSHPLFLATEYGVRPVPELGQMPAALLVEGESPADDMVVRPVTLDCQLHRECQTHGTVVNLKGAAQAWVECEHGSTDVACLPPLMQDVTIPVEPGIRDLVYAAELHDRRLELRRSWGSDRSGKFRMSHLYSGGPLYYDPVDKCLRGGGHYNDESMKLRDILHDRRVGFCVGNSNDVDWGGARWERPLNLDVLGRAYQGMW